MQEQRFEKILTANDTGETGGHQAGMHIPKSETDLLAFLPRLDPGQKNPDAWLNVTDERGTDWKFRFIHYNNRLHDPRGTRDEYRITHMTKYFRSVGATEGDKLVLSGVPGVNCYRIQTMKDGYEHKVEEDGPVRVRLKGWKRVH